MTYPQNQPDPQPWPPAGQPQYGQPQYGQPQYGQPQYGQPQYPPPTGPQGYPPPPPGAPPAPPGYPPSGFPGAQPPKRKSRVGLIVGIIVLVVVVLCGGGILLAALSGGTKNGNSTSAGGAGQATKGQATKGQGQAQARAGLNQPVRDGKFEFVVRSVTCGKTQEGDSLLNKSAQGQYCEVVLTIKNVGTQPQMFDGSSQKAKGTNGSTYTHDGVAEIYANKDAQTFLNTINPGNQAQGILVFDLPKNVKIASLELHDSPFSGGVTVTVG